MRVVWAASVAAATGFLWNPAPTWAGWPAYKGDTMTFVCDAQGSNWCQFQLYQGTRNFSGGEINFSLPAGQSGDKPAAVGWEYCVAAGNPPPPPGTGCTLKTVGKGQNVGP